ncbi:MAG: histidine kinase [Anaerolineales bacterium]|nr:histidine kinase [Anaerolineales bacterium]
MNRPIRHWYGGPIGELLAVVLPALPFGLGVGYATGHYLESLVVSLAISIAVYAFLKLDIAFIHPLFRKLSPGNAVLMETLSGLIEHVLGAWLAFTACNLLFGRPFQGAKAWWLAGGTVVTIMIVHAITYTLYSHAEIKRNIVEEERLRAMTTEAELKALKAQINPHFLFNTLNTIAELIHSEPAQAEATVERLAGMFRYVLAGNERGLAPLREELTFVDNYLLIEQARFGERLRVSRDIAPEALDIAVPALIIQPLVENAIRHGRGDNGQIDLGIHIRIVDDDVEISVTDQGPGMPADFQLGESSGIGLNNVHERLTKSYGASYGLEITSDNIRGAKVTIRIPGGEKT